MPTYVAPTLGAALAQAALDRLDADSSPGYLELYAGTVPAGGGAPIGPLVCAPVLQNPAGTVVGGALQLAVPSTGAFVFVSAAPTWARLYDGAGVALLDVKARLQSVADDPDDPAAIVVLADALEAGALVQITAGAISFGG